MAQLNTALCVDLQVEVREENDEIWCKDEKVKIIEAQWNRCLLMLPRSVMLTLSVYHSSFLFMEDKNAVFRA